MSCGRVKVGKRSTVELREYKKKKKMWKMKRILQLVHIYKAISGQFSMSTTWMHCTDEYKRNHMPSFDD